MLAGAPYVGLLVGAYLRVYRAMDGIALPRTAPHATAVKRRRNDVLAEAFDPTGDMACGITPHARRE